MPMGNATIEEKTT